MAEQNNPDLRVGGMIEDIFGSAKKENTSRNDPFMSRTYDFMNKSYNDMPAPYNVVVKPVNRGGLEGIGYESALARYNEQLEKSSIPTFSVTDTGVKLTGSASSKDKPLVREAQKILSETFKGADLSDASTRQALSKTVDEINKQIKSNYDWEYYQDFLESKNFSDAAYRNYAAAQEVMESVNPSKSETIIEGYDKDDKWHGKDDDPWKWRDWINHWMTTMDAEERARYWIKALQAYNKAAVSGGDENLYAALPFILMGSTDVTNVPAGILNAINPFDGGKGYDDAKTKTPIYGFEDTNGLSVIIQSAATQLGTGALELISGVAEAVANPWENLGTQNGSQYFGFDFSADRDLPEMDQEDIDYYRKIYESYKDLPSESLDSLGYLKNLTPYERLANYWGEDTARKAVVADAFPREESYKDFREQVLEYEHHGVGKLKEVTDKAIADMNAHVSDMAVYDPNAATTGIITGTIARIALEQAALGLVSGGALTAPKIAERLTRAGWRLADTALKTTELGQRILSKAPSVARAIGALANGSAKGLDTASKIIYGIGSIGTWAVREVGEDAVRGIIDDAIMQNSFDSQGNLDANKFLENVYMNAVALAMAKGVRGAIKGIGAVVDNAKTRDIDGVELNGTQQAQLKMLQKALDDQNRWVRFRGYDESGHPVIVNHGIEKTLDEITLSEDVRTAVDEALDIASPTAGRTAEQVLEDSDIPEETRSKISTIFEEEKAKDGEEGSAERIKTRLEETLTDDELRQAFPDGTVKIGDDIIKVDTKEFTSGDINRVGGQNFKTMDEAIEGLAKAQRTSDFVNSINGIMRTAKDFAKSWAEAVKEFADNHNMTVRDVMIEIRNSRIAGEETVSGLKELWDTYWKPTQDKLLDVQERITGIRPVSHDFYFRDMVEGTFRPSESGAWTIDTSGTEDLLGGDATFDLSASSTAKNTGKLGEIAPDKLEYDPEVLAREFVASRLQTIWAGDDMGKIFTTLQEAHDAGEYDFTEADAAKSVETTQKVSTEVENSEGVQEIQNLSNVEELGADFGNTQSSKPENPSVGEAEELADTVKADKKQILDAQKKFNESATKSNAAEQLSRSSGYKSRGTRVNAGKPVGVNYMPGNPFKGLANWVNDHFVKANSIKMRYADPSGAQGYKSVTAYNAGYKMYAESGSFARNVIVDIQNGETLWDAIYKQIRNNGFFIEPTKSQRRLYGALTSEEQAAKITDKIMDRMNKDARFSHAFNDDGTVKDTATLISMLSTRFKGQGINDFTKFVRKANWDSFTKGEQSWLNKRMYEMTASVNKNTAAKIIQGLVRGSMALRYKSNMWFNYKNAQLQLTEIQRLFTMNKIGDFANTLKRLVSDSDFRSRVSDYAYILAADSFGHGLTRGDLDKAADAMVKVGAGSAISKDGILTNIDNIKAKFGEIDDTVLSPIEGAEYAKNFILIAGFLAAGEKMGLEGGRLDDYIRNRFNTEALAGTKVGKIGLTDSKIGQFTFMYMGFPIRELTLQWHMLRGGGIKGGDTKFDKFVGAAEYMMKMLGAKGFMWAAEAPWGYTLMDQLGVDPFGWTDQYDQMPNNFEDRDPIWRWLDLGIQYNPFFQGAMTSEIADVYFYYRAAEEKAREDYKEDHNGSTEGFEWSLADAGSEWLSDALKGLTPGNTAMERVTGELSDLDRGYHISQSGNRQYSTNYGLGDVGWGLLAGRRNTPNAQEYNQIANPIRGLAEGGLPGLGQQLGRANPFRGFREFDPIDTDTYRDWFDGSYQDQQNWRTGVYAFRDEAQQIKDKYDKYANNGTAVNDMNSRENELGDLRKRVELFVQAYTDKHPEGISREKENQLINIFNLNDYTTTLDEAFSETQGSTDYSDWNAAQNRYSQGNFPTAYGIQQNKKGENSYSQSPQLEQALSEQRYGISSEVTPMIKQMYNTQKFNTPEGVMTMKDYHDKIYAKLQPEWNKDKPDYDVITKTQEEYLEQVSKNIIQPILNTYGSSVLSAGRSSDIMQEFGKILYGMVPSNEYRIDKKGKTVYQSTPYMTIDIPKWLNKNFSAFGKVSNTTDKATRDRIDAIKNSLNQGHTSTAMARARALVQDIGLGKASVSRDELEWLQGILND